MNQWVQHISGQGEKYETVGSYPKSWVCICDRNTSYYLPKSDYKVCEPPEVWENVTAECEVDKYGNILHGKEGTISKPYRRRKVQLFRRTMSEAVHADGRMAEIEPQWAIVIERLKNG